MIVIAADLNVGQLEDALWKGAKGLYHAEASVLLLGFHDYWLRNGRMRKAIDLDDDSPADQIDDRWAWVNWPQVFDPAGGATVGGSSSAMTVLRIAGSLAGHLKVDLHDGLASLDDSNLRLVLAAMSHAARGFDRPGPVAWPARP